MTPSAQAYPWTSDQVTVLGQWDSRSESVEQVALRLEPTLRAVEAAMGGTVSWTDVMTGQEILDVSDIGLRSFVAAAAAVDDFGDARPDSGFEFAISGVSVGQGLVLQFTVGSATAGRRKLSNSVAVEFGPATASQVETVLLTVVEFWEPTVAVAWDPDTAVLSGGRGRFTPAVGQRTWLSDAVGAVGTAPDGVRSEQIAGGTLLSADDTWTPQEVNRAMVAALVDNEITTVPHGPQAPGERSGAPAPQSED